MFSEDQLNFLEPLENAGSREEALKKKVDNPEVNPDLKPDKVVDPVAQYWQKVYAQEKPEAKEEGTISNKTEPASPELLIESQPLAENPIPPVKELSPEQIEELFKDVDPWKDLGHNYENEEEKE